MANKIICYCLWYTLTRVSNDDTNYELKNTYSVNTILNVDLTAGQTFNLTVNCPDCLLHISPLNVTWYHTYLHIDDPDIETYITRIVKNKIFFCDTKNCLNELNLAVVGEIENSGEYYVIISAMASDLILAGNTFLIKVYSNELFRPLVSFKDTKTNEIVKGYLENNLLFRFICSSRLYHPHSDIQMNWFSWCDKTDELINVAINNFTLLTGTFGKILYFESKPLFNGVLNCTVNEKWTAYHIIASDIPRKPGFSTVVPAFTWTAFLKHCAKQQEYLETKLL